MTLKEAAALLGVTPDNLRGAIKRGALRAEKHGRDWWVTDAEVERYRRENRRQTTEQAVRRNAVLDEQMAEEGARISVDPDA
jgi:excisionase family DNA binding protein